MQKYKEQKDDKVTWGGFLNEFLWLCAGVNRDILRQCPTDYAKYAGTGGTILFTALMAMLSGGYALSTVFNNAHPAVWCVFGIFWGLLIFNLDRLIVNTMYSDGKPTISWMELMSGLPRIIMAIFLGFVISTPLELKIYEDEISIQIEKDKNVERDRLIANDQHRLDSLQVRKTTLQSAPPPSAANLQAINIGNNELMQENNNLHAQADNLTGKIASENSKINQYSNLNRQEAHQGQYTNRIAQARSRRAEYQRQLRQVNMKINDNTAKLMANDQDFKKHVEVDQAQKKKDVDAIDKDIETLSARINKKDTTFDKTLSEKYGGFQARMKAFNEMKESEPSTKWSALFITLLFIIIECAPTFFKMMMSEGSYDDMLRAERAKLYAKTQEIISRANDETNTILSISTQENKEKMDAQIKANKLLMEKLSTVQAELLEKAIDKWREEELKKVEENPSAYIHSNTKQ